MEESGNARIIAAPELIGPTSGVVTPVRRFVGSVSTVHASVTNPRLYDTMTAVFAFELGRTALRYSGRVFATLHNRNQTS